MLEINIIGVSFKTILLERYANEKDRFYEGKE
jgi:hypothetical protein